MTISPLLSISKIFGVDYNEFRFFYLADNGERHEQVCQ